MIRALALLALALLTAPAGAGVEDTDARCRQQAEEAAQSVAELREGWTACMAQAGYEGAAVERLAEHRWGGDRCILFGTAQTSSFHASWIGALLAFVGFYRGGIRLIGGARSRVNPTRAETVVIATSAIGAMLTWLVILQAARAAYCA